MHTNVYSNQVFISLMHRYVDADGHVDYERWKQSGNDRRALNRQVDLLARISPENRPDLFPGAEAKRSYWISTYNTLVIQAILKLWPLQSVRAFKMSMSSRLIPGKGFFYDHKVVVGGRKTNLFKLENSIIRKQVRDPRIHFSLNCASISCPVARPSGWSEIDLEEAARDFINTPANVLVKNGKVHLSRLFKWYQKDFPANLYRYLQGYAAAPLHAQLQTATEQHFGREYFKYDWDLNDAGDTGDQEY